MLEIAFQQLVSEYHTDPTNFAGFLSTLACYVMTDPTPYKRWRDEIIKRFQLLYPRNDRDLFGDVVPRQAVDPGYDFQTEQTEALVNRFLSVLNYRDNPFLSSPNGMLEHFEGEWNFKGTPYLFDIRQDRQERGLAKVDEHGE